MKEVIYLYDANGNVTIYADKRDAALKLGFGFINNSVARYLGNPCNNNYANDYNYKDYGSFILRNEYGEVLLFEDFEKILNEIREERYLERMKKLRLYRNYWNGVGPVPGTGVSANGHYFRHPRTLKTLKYATGVNEEFEPIVRIRGGKGAVPTAWDDLGLHKQRNWKKYRKTQYK